MSGISITQVLVFSPLILASVIFDLVICGIGIAVSLLLFFLSRKKRIPIYRCRTTRLITSSLNQIDGLDILYDNKKLNALSISKVALWNAGRETISGTDVSELDRLRVSLNTKYEFLSCHILSQTKIANNFSAQIADDKKSIILLFDYIDHNEGVVLKIRHTGSSSSDINVDGSIKAVRTIKRSEETMSITPNTSKSIQRMRKNRWWLLLLSISLLALGFLLLFYSDWLVEQRLGWNGIVFGRTFIFVFVLFLMNVSTSVLSRFSDLSNIRIPQSLLSHYMNEDF